MFKAAIVWVGAALLLAGPAAMGVLADGWQAGVARAPITPQRMIWMSGYAARTAPAQGKEHDLWAKALAVRDPRGARVVVVTLDLVGIDRELSLKIRNDIRRKHALGFDRVALCTSHTHTGPVIGSNLAPMYFLTDRQWQWINEYTDEVHQTVVKIVGEALADLEPCTLAYGTGEATFAVNRRNNPEGQVPQLKADGKLSGPVDHDVPVLKVTDAEGGLKAVLFGYACHATTLSFNRWTGDYPGFAMTELERSHPGTTAMFWAGCGADINPIPRRSLELAQDYGRQLAASVDEVLAGPMKPVEGTLGVAYHEIDLPFAKLPTRDELVAQTQSSNKYEASRAKMLLTRIDAGEPLSPTYPYPVQTWRIGDELLFITLGGEVVVDFALLFKEKYGRETTWVAGYTNDVMAYIPSLRVLREGGYEGGGAMVYYGLPSVWGEAVEKLIVDRVAADVEAVGVKP